MKEELRIAMAKGAYSHLHSFLNTTTERKDWETLTPVEQADYFNFVERMIRHLGSNEVQEAWFERASLLPHSFGTNLVRRANSFFSNQYLGPLSRNSSNGLRTGAT